MNSRKTTTLEIARAIEAAVETSCNYTHATDAVEQVQNIACVLDSLAVSFEMADGLTTKKHQQYAGLLARIAAHLFEDTGEEVSV